MGWFGKRSIILTLAVLLAAWPALAAGIPGVQSFRISNVDGTIVASVRAGSSLPVATDPALVVTIRDALPGTITAGGQDTTATTRAISTDSLGNLNTLTEPQVRRLFEQMVIQLRVIILLLQQLKDPGPSATPDGFQEATQ